jgi:hypothetical protein
MLRCNINGPPGLRAAGRRCATESESGNSAGRKHVCGRGRPSGGLGELDIRVRIRHDSRDAVLRDAVLRGAGLTRHRVIRS